ncbi:MAG: multicopper oxidase domain-containing protein [Gemmatimonadetes bacterium]|nr:multicopper oxidase domain-containing protein [Gemmatimonadota bacterium]
MNRLTLSALGITTLTAAWTFGATDVPSIAPSTKIVFNDNRDPAGALVDGLLELELEIVQGSWHLLGDDEPAGEVLAFAERGKAPSIPGPLIRVPLGTEVHVTVTNPLDTAIVIRGLGARHDGAIAPLRLAPGTTRDVQFMADVEGTYFYWGALTAARLGDRNFEDSQLSGVLAVDGPNTPTDDRIMMIGVWFDGRLPDGSPDFGREFLVINGRPWPHTERLTYDMGDSIRWRLVNTSSDTHAMHLHGFYFRVDARGDMVRDTLYWPQQRRMAVTERFPSGTTMSLVWSPDRPGGWIFHCHMSVHVAPNATMGPDRLSEEQRFLPLFQEGHHDADPNMHAVQGMGGLLMATYVRPPPGWVPNEPKRREMRLFINSVPASGGLSGRQFGYVLQEGDREPARDSVRLPGPTLVLRKGEPTSIRVFNRTDEPSQVHWHGLEIESYFDGVAGLGGYPERLTPAILPGDSFEIRITPPRAGSFMYHTHINDLRQQGSGLYGAFVVLDEGERWDPQTDRVFIFGETPFRDDEIPVLNGANPPEPITFRVGTTYRLRFMDITLNRPNTRLRFLRDGFPVLWMPLAKDGFDLPPGQRTLQRAERTIAVGETMDYRYTPDQPGELHLELRQGNGVLLFDQVVMVVQ